MSIDCPDCVDRGTVDGCRNCGRTRPETDKDRQFAEWDRQDAARKACTVYQRHMNVRCSLGTQGCPLHHGR